MTRVIERWLFTDLKPEVKGDFTFIVLIEGDNISYHKHSNPLRIHPYGLEQFERDREYVLQFPLTWHLERLPDVEIKE